jgi:hypothetical protein
MISVFVFYVFGLVSNEAWSGVGLKLSTEMALAYDKVFPTTL